MLVPSSRALSCSGPFISAENKRDRGKYPLRGRNFMRDQYQPKHSNLCDEQEVPRRWGRSRSSSVGDPIPHHLDAHLLFIQV